MYIESIRLKNFKSFRSVQISDIPRLCVVVGANGVGKTTLFEVFAFLKDSLVQKCCAPCLTLTISMCSS